MSSEVVVRVPAKVNLALHVGGLDGEGYHSLATVFQAVSLYDDIIARPNPSGGITLAIRGEGADDLPADDTNLAWRAAQLLADRVGVDADVTLTLNKGIPVAGGMAGGSADAAGALVACDALWDTALSRSELAQLAAQLGADVPFALHGGTALGTGRGDQLTPVLGRGQFHWVFALAEGGLSTPAVFKELDRLRTDAVLPEPQVRDALMSALRSGDAFALGAALVNEMQAAALSLRPELQRVLEAGRDAGALGAIVSGSGPTCAFLVSDPEAAVDLAVALSGVGVCRTVRTASGPVPGARLV